MANLTMIVGNGLTIDFCLRRELMHLVDPTNLFRYGDLVPWPDSDRRPGFLSSFHCPHLWSIGARPHMTGEEAYCLIEEILTCVNAISLGKTKRANTAHAQAYFELVEYLKHLFIHYDEKVLEEDGFSDIESWDWARFLMDSSECFDSINIITFCYDVFLERAMLACGVDFSVAGFDHSVQSKIRVFKPHGSISFCHKHTIDAAAYYIPTNWDFADAGIDDFEVRYDDLFKNYAVSAIIPPAGDPGRLNRTWSSTIRQHIMKSLGQVTDGDCVVVSGLSYWHVDR